VIIADDDTIPHPDSCCGVEPKAVYGPVSVISCPKCREKVILKTPPFFRDGDSQREHEAWRTVSAWNALIEVSFPC